MPITWDAVTMLKSSAWAAARIEHPQRAGEPFDMLAGVVDQAAALGEVPRIPHRDVRVVDGKAEGSCGGDKRNDEAAQDHPFGTTQTEAARARSGRGCWVSGVHIGHRASRRGRSIVFAIARSRRSTGMIRCAVCS